MQGKAERVRCRTCFITVPLSHMHSLASHAGFHFLYFLPLFTCLVHIGLSAALIIICTGVFHL